MKNRRLSKKEIEQLRNLENVLSRVIAKKKLLEKIPGTAQRIEKGTEIERILVKAMIWVEKGHAQRLGEEIKKLNGLGLEFKFDI